MEDIEHGKRDVSTIMDEQQTLTTGYADAHTKCAENVQQVNETVRKYHMTQATQRETRTQKRLRGHAPPCAKNTVPSPTSSRPHH